MCYTSPWRIVKKRLVLEVLAFLLLCFASFKRNYAGSDLQSLIQTEPLASSINYML